MVVHIAGRLVLTQIITVFLKIEVIIQYLEMLKKLSGLTESQFKRSYKRISEKINLIYDNDEYDLVFKGKWYSNFLNYEINQLSQNCPANTQGFLNRITGCIVTLVDFDASWADHFKIPLQRMASEVK